MSQKTFSWVAAAIFFLIAVLHALRLFLGWEAVIGGWMVPMWWSWPAFVVALFLVWSAWKGTRA